MKKPVVLMILDGLGIRSEETGNAVAKAHMPVLKKMMSEYPNTQLQASGSAVGLPEGQMGNSEVGHLNIGAGRVVYQELTRISKSVEDGSFFNNDILTDAMKEAKQKEKTLHLMGLLSDGGVHSHIDHLFALLDMAKKYKVKNVAVHCFLDGRDTSPRSAIKYIEALENKIRNTGVGNIVTVNGRYYAMDRDKRWDRTQKAYNAMVMREGLEESSAVDAVKNAYERGENDEFVQPTVIKTENDANLQINAEDSIIFFNFRPDRARQITRALLDEEFTHFDRVKKPSSLHYVTMTQYDQTILGPKVAFEPQSLNNTLGEVLAVAEKKQLRIAETEKYAHVTYFFNGGIEEANEGEERILIPSPQIATYDLKPDMSAYEVTQTLINRMDQNDFDFIVINFANPDMVGHTGKMDAVVKALETVDECAGRIMDKVLELKGALIVTSDHGNSEELEDVKTGKTVTAHTTNPVPLILIGLDKCILKENGKLCDLAPTILDIMEMDQPEEMTGESLLNPGWREEV
ncbi:MAG: 2,3-bisphosphoglycerate-independent phosphoglycerate mutase [Tindallia sp. MSAO_Bac2]|nr:MAG: 2,3-bisphosphoglycerate-independent phosphoglycerate mutase [Tindallia sp. MSAO_Bac2]